MSGIYLKAGEKTVGPYTEEEFTKLRDSGELVKYTAIFRHPDTGWETLTPPPPMNTAPAAHAPPPTRRASPETARAPARKAQRLTHGYDVVIHDYRQMISGTITQLTEFGCEVICHGDEGPTFSKEHPVQLNILDPKTGESTQVLARLDRMGRSDGQWSYRLLWDETPELLAA